MASTQVLWPLTAAAWLWANSLTGQTSTGSTAADRIAFTRLNTYALEVGEPGVAVVRDSAAWWTLWQYFGHEYRSQWDAPLPDSIATPPPVDFGRNMIVLVRPAGRWGCDGHAIASIEFQGQVLRVVLGPDHPPEKWSLICDPEVGTPVDAVVLERDTREAEFVAGRPDYAVPKRARWWTPPSIEAALDTGQSALKLLSWRRLTRDSTLPFSDLRRLAVAAAAQVGPGLGLLGNPRVRSSVELLTILRSVPRARELLFRLHAYAVARDQRADTASLEVIIDGLRRGGDHPDLAYLLVRNMPVQKNEPLLRSLHYVVQGDSAACSVALKAYASRWPVRREILGSAPGTAYELLRCPEASPRAGRETPHVQLVHFCGTTFRVRNSLPVAADVEWEVADSAEGGRLTVPPRGRAPYSEVFLTTRHRGVLRLYRDGGLIQIQGNNGPPCPIPPDTTRTPAPVARLFFPEDIKRFVVPTGDTVRYYRRLVRVVFYDTTGGDQVRRAVRQWRAAIVAGGPYPSPYILRVPDPGPKEGAFDSLLARLRDEPGVQDVYPLAVAEPIARR